MAYAARAGWKRLGPSTITSCRPWKLSARPVRRVWKWTAWPTWFDYVLRRRPTAAFRLATLSVLRAAVGADPYRAGLGGEPAHGRGAGAARAGAQGRRGVAARSAGGARAAAALAAAGPRGAGRRGGVPRGGGGRPDGGGGGLVAAVSGRVQARPAQARPLRRGPIVRAGAVSGSNGRGSA